MNLAINASQINDGTYSVTTASGDSATVTKNGDKFTITNSGISGVIEVEDISLEELEQIALKAGITDISVPKSVLTSSKALVTSNTLLELMKLMIDTLMVITNANRESDLNARNGIFSALESKLTAMQESADKEKESAMHSAYMNMISGAISLATGSVTMGLSIAGGTGKISFKLGKDGGALDPNAAAMTNQGVVQSVGQFGSALGSINQAAWGMDIADLNYEAQMSKKDVELANAIMEFFKQALSSSGQSMESIMSQLKTILQLLTDLRQNTTATEQLIAQHC